MNEVLFDGSGYIAGDYGLAVLISLSALLTYGRIAFEMRPTRMFWPRVVMGFGFTLWALRFWLTMSKGGDVMVAPVSMAAIGMITAGYCAVQLISIRRAIALARHPLWCLREPAEPCQREDRVQEVLKK